MESLPPPLTAWSPGTLVASGAEASDERLFVIMERAARAACAGGLRGLMLREPHLQDGALVRLGRRLRNAMTDGWFGVHDRVHLAAELDAHGVHLGGASLPVDAAREVVGADCIVGVSTHAGDGPETWRGASYVVHGPVFAPNSKDAARDAVGVEALAAFSRDCELPTYGLGGIDTDRIAGLSEAASGAAVIGALWGTGPEPITGQRSRLEDAAGIEERARALTSAAIAAFDRTGGAR